MLKHSDILCLAKCEAMGSEYIVKVLKTVMKDMMGMNSANKKPEKPTMTSDFFKGPVHSK